MTKLWKGVGLLLLATGLVIVVLRAFFVDMAFLEGEDMLPSLGKDAWVVVKRRTEPQRGDLLLFAHQGRYLVRRVIALPGERVALHGTKPVVDGVAATRAKVRTTTIRNRDYTVLREELGGRSYLIFDDTIRTLKDMPEKKVEGGVFVLADHREHGTDSRELGAIPKDRIRGVVWSVLRRGEIP